MRFSTDKFVGDVVAVVVAIIIFAMVAVPVIGTATASIEDAQLKMILNVIPIFIVIGILLACIYMFLNNKE